MKKVRIYSISAIFLGIFFSQHLIPALAASSASINATVKINVCGDNDAADGEECDNTDFDGKTCRTYNYKSGSLICDPSCSIDISNCSTVEEDSNDEDNYGDNLATEKEEESLDTSELLAPPKRTTYTRVFEVFELPNVLKNFDSDNDNKLETHEIRSIATQWNKYWEEYIQSGNEEKCDSNADKLCNLSDFSVLMYYIDR